MTPIICEISYVRKYKSRGSKDYRTIPVVHCAEFGVSTSGDGMVVKQMAEKLKELSADLDRPFHVFNGNNLAFKPVKLSLWTDPPDRRPEQLKQG